MPEVLWLLEHVRLRVDPLKDAAGSPFGKADNVCHSSAKMLKHQCIMEGTDKEV